MTLEDRLQQYKEQAIIDQSRIVDLQSLLLKVYDRWWPLVAKQPFASNTAVNLREEVTATLNHTGEESVDVVKALALKEIAQDLPKKVWTTEEVAEYLLVKAETKTLNVNNSTEERLKDVPF